MKGRTRILSNGLAGFLVDYEQVPIDSDPLFAVSIDLGMRVMALENCVGSGGMCLTSYNASVTGNTDSSRSLSYAYMRGPIYTLIRLQGIGAGGVQVNRTYTNVTGSSGYNFLSTTAFWSAVDFKPGVLRAIYMASVDVEIVVVSSSGKAMQIATMDDLGSIIDWEFYLAANHTYNEIELGVFESVVAVVYWDAAAGNIGVLLRVIDAWGMISAETALSEFSVTSDPTPISIHFQGTVISVFYHTVYNEIKRKRFDIVGPFTTTVPTTTTTSTTTPSTTQSSTFPTTTVTTTSVPFTGTFPGTGTGFTYVASSTTASWPVGPVLVAETSVFSLGPCGFMDLDLQFDVSSLSIQVDCIRSGVSQPCIWDVRPDYSRAGMLYIRFDENGLINYDILDNTDPQAGQCPLYAVDPDQNEYCDVQVTYGYIYQNITINDTQLVSTFQSSARQCNGAGYLSTWSALVWFLVCLIM